MAVFPVSHLDLLQDTGTAALATISPTGHPQVTAVVYLLDDDGDLKISLNETRHKVRNMQRNPRCTLFVLDPGNPRRYLEIRADAEIAPDPGKVFAAKAGRKYGLDFTRRDNPGEERVIVTLRPARVHAVEITPGAKA